MKKHWRLILVIVAVVSFGIALSYPVLYRLAEEKNNHDLEDLAKIREQILKEEEKTAVPESGSESSDPDSGQDDKNRDSHPEAAAGGEEKQGGVFQDSDLSAIENADEKSALPSGAPSETDEDEERKTGESPGNDSDGKEKEGPIKEAQDDREVKAVYKLEDLLLDYVPGLQWKQVVIPEYEGADAPVLLFNYETAENRDERNSPLPYSMKKKVRVTKDKILPELLPIYELNNDLVGWLSIDGTVVDYPVVQSRDSEYYLHHDFYGDENENGQIILDTNCDPFTPSYNLVISGHHMRNKSMFGGLTDYKDEAYYKEHRFVEFDTLLERKSYVIFAAFASADYDEYEEGFRYNADIVYRIDAEQWLENVWENSLYETGIDAEYGDEFLTLTTCDRTRRNDGRFVLVCRRIREGEMFE
ncbi:MAG: sortase [Blautia sp.]|nr:sortase [Blautia sp.]